VLKAGFIGAIVGFIYITILSFLSPFCTLCFVPLLGVGVGYLACQFDSPTTLEASLRQGSLAGGMTGSAVIFGQIVATVVNGILLTNLKDWATMTKQLGMTPITPTDYWQMTLVTNSFCSLFNMLTLVILAASGGLWWFYRHRPKGF